MAFLDIGPGHRVVLSSGGDLPEQMHVFDETSIHAVNAALAARRPLLVRGEPGAGKSQLARATAKALGRAYVPHVVDARTESRDLLWHFDAVARLAEAQLAGALGGSSAEGIRDRLQVKNYLGPGPLWWAFDWLDAEKQAKAIHTPKPVQLDGGDPARGCIVLVDEVDKAESDVPNGLLEALGAGEFTPPGRDGPVRAGGIPPLVVVTTNEERALPDAFVRRCMVLFLSLPDGGDDLIDFLIGRGRAHFPHADEAVLRGAAEQLAQDREEARSRQYSPLPGQAEYLDLVRAVVILKPDDPAAQRALLEVIGRFALKKHLGSVS